MPPPPRFKNELTQKTVTAVLMVVTLGVSVALAQWIVVARSSNRAHQPAPSTPGRVQPWLSVPPSLQYRVPTGWSQNPAIDHAFELRSGIDQADIYIDPQHPMRQLLIAQERFSEQIAADDVVQGALLSLTAPKLRHAMQVDDVQPFSQPPITGVYMIARSATADNVVHVHFVAALTQNHTNYWLIYLADRLPGDERDSDWMITDTQVYLQILKSLQIEVRS